MNIIVPAAGLSSRFPGMKPKYLLYDYKHELMLMNALKPFHGKFPIYIGILKSHDEEFNASEFIKYEFGDLSVSIVILDKPTKGPADTVYQIIKKAKIQGEILIKDCDSFFDHEITPGNYICVSDIKKHDVLKKISSKSFVIYNEQDIVTNIIEKNVVSDTFCVGGYKFDDAKLFVDTFEEISHVGEIFVSDIIERCIHKKHIFTKKSVINYFDVGTAEDWFEYNDKPVIFCDIDGTIVENQTRVGSNSYDSDPVPLTKNVNRILHYQTKGSQLVFTTSRLPNVRKQTEKLLDDLGFRNYTLIMGLLNSRRILINDYNKANPYPRAEAVNILRNRDELDNFL